MKKLFLLIYVLLALQGFSTTYYVSTAGNDANAGTLGSPWLTLHHACATVTTSGDVIHVIEGTYLENGQMSLSPGVSIEGDGVTSVIEDTVTVQFVPILSLSSAEGTNGNQHISNLKFDGRSLATSWAIAIGGRSNVSIYNCTFVDFMETGVNWSGRNDGTQAAPSTYATGNSFHDNIMNNCATFAESYGRGCFQFGGQDGMQIYNNTITNNSRSDGANGWPIKGCNNSYIKNCRIHNNILASAAFPYSYAGQYNYWDFAVELFYNLGGNEIDHNTITGSIDVNHQSRSSGYSLYIHENTIGFPSMQAHHQYGIILEFSSDSVIVDNNIIRNVAKGISFSLRGGDTVQHTVISRNLIHHVGTAQGSNFGAGIDLITNGTDTYRFLNNSYYNNTIVADLTYPPYWGIVFGVNNASTATSQINNFKVENNIVEGFNAAAVVSNFLGSITNSYFSYNDFYGNGNSDAPFPSWASSTTLGGSNTVASNTTVDPLFVGGGDYTLQSGSTMIDAGVNVGFSYTGSAPDKGFAEHTTYYVSTTGNDANDGSAAHPWLTLYHACATATTPGDLIHVNAGTYTETNQSILAPLVNIEGADSSTTIIKSSLSADFTAIILMSSVEGTEGSQHITGIKFDGQSLTTYWGIEIGGRSNVLVHDCVAINFKDAFIYWKGRNDATDGPPTIYATGNSFYNNRTFNCSRYTGFGTGHLYFGGQQDFLIYNNYMVQQGRGTGNNGWLLKCQANGGYSKNCQVYSNTFIKDQHLSGGAYDFGVESFNEESFIVHDNNFVDCGLDMNSQLKGSYTYGAHIYNNNFTTTSLPTQLLSAITIEFTSENVLIENNTADGFTQFVLETVRPGCHFDNVTIQKNLSVNMGISGGVQGMAIRWEPGTSGRTGNITTRNYKVLNNTFITTGDANASIYGIRLPDGNPDAPNLTYCDSTAIINNIFMGFGETPIVANPGANIDSLFIRNNDFYSNGNSDDPIYNGGTPTNIFSTGNIKTDPDLDGSYVPNSGSPVIDAGIDVGLPFVDSAPDIGYAEYGASSKAFRSGNEDIPEPGILSNSNSGDLVVNVRPNPFTSYFNLFVKTNDPKAISLVIFDIMGRKMEAVNNVQHNKWVHLGEELANGIYFVQISQGLQKKIIKVFKQ